MTTSLMSFHKLIKWPSTRSLLTFSPGLITKDALIKTGSRFLSYASVTPLNSTRPWAGQDSSSTSASFSANICSDNQIVRWIYVIDFILLQIFKQISKVHCIINYEVILLFYQQFSKDHKKLNFQTTAKRWHLMG